MDIRDVYIYYMLWCQGLTDADNQGMFAQILTMSSFIKAVGYLRLSQVRSNMNRHKDTLQNLASAKECLHRFSNWERGLVHC